MLLKRLAIDRFGIWHNWEVEDIPRGLAVFFGPNETGKSTILEFVRGMFFGLAARSRFLLGEQGDIGGTLVLEHLGREVRLSRHWSQDEGERVQVVVDGQPVLPEELMRVLCPVDEATFNAVFALGLEDLAYLRTLEEGETAKLLYELSLGADRAVLWRVLTNLHQRLAQDQDDTELKELEAERARLVRTTEEAGLETRQYVRWRVTQRKLQAERQLVVKRLQSQQREQQRCEAVLDLLPKWQQYREMRLQWKRLGPSRRISEKALRKLDRWKERMTAAKHNLAEAREALGQYDEALAGLPVDSLVLEHAAEIEALRLHRDEMVACKERLEELNRRQQELLQARSALWEGLASVTQIGHIPAPNDGLPQVDQRGTAQDWSALRGWIRRWQKTVLERDGLAEEDQRQRAAQNALKEQVEAALQKHGVADAQVALSQYSEQVTGLRRVRQLAEQQAAVKQRVEQVTTEYHRQVAQSLPSWQTWAGVGSLFIPGLTLVFLSLLALLGGPGAGNLGLVTLLLGAAMTGGGIGLKFYHEHRQRVNLENLKKDLETLTTELQSVSQEYQRLAAEQNVSQADLDQLISQLEGRIRELEPVAVLQAKFAEMTQPGQTHRETLHRLEQKERAIRAKFNELAHRLGLPSADDVTQALQIWEVGHRLRALDRRLTVVTAKLKKEEERLAAWQKRVLRLARLCGRSDETDDVVQVLDGLVRHYEIHLENQRRRQDLLRTAKQTKQKVHRAKRRLKKIALRYRATLRQLGVRNPQEATALRQTWEQAQTLRRQAGEIHRELKAALAAAGIAEDVPLARLFQETKAKHAELIQAMEATKEELHALEEKQAHVEAELARLVQSRDVDQAKLALAALEHQIVRRVRRQQTSRLLAELLERVRQHYELENQPETLRRASVFLAQMTEGRYVRVWTPISERVLLVEDATGKNWRVDELSRGTREQLFLSFRLAIVERSAEQGIRLPLVLDDVLVNFDFQRAAAACRTLRAFAEASHQVLLLTCHDHIARLCTEMSVPVAHLETTGGGKATPPFFRGYFPPLKTADTPIAPTTPETPRLSGSQEEKTVADGREKVLSQEPSRSRRRRKQTPNGKAVETEKVLGDHKQPGEMASPSAGQVFFQSNCTWLTEAEPYADVNEEGNPQGEAKGDRSSAEPVGNHRAKQRRARAA